MSHLIDNDVYIDFLGKDPQSTDCINGLLPAGIAISIVTHMESFQGTFRQSDPIASQEQAGRVVDRIPIQPISRATTERYALLRHDLSRAGRRVRHRVLNLMMPPQRCRMVWFW